MGPIFFSLALLPRPVLAQDQASIGAGLGVVRHETGSSFSAFTVSPGVQRVSPSLYMGAAGALSLLEVGVWAEQARADIWADVFPAFTSDSRIAVTATASASGRSDGLAAGSGAALLEVVWSRQRGGWAIGAGSAGGVIKHADAVGSPRWRGRAWFQRAPQSAQLLFTVEGTHFLGAWYTDLVAGVTFERPRVSGSAWASARVSATYGSTGAASGTIQFLVRPRVALEVSGGSYLRDPFQGLPRAGFVAGGIRLFGNSRRPLATPSPRQFAALQPLVAEHRGGDTVVVRFRMPGAHTLAIAGNWNSWTPDSLHGLGEDIWEAALLLPSGTYYFNLVVDGKEWVVPGGVATIPDGMGGMIAVLNVL
jgi:hypothetical protein